MANTIVYHPIADNSLIIENNEHTGLGIEKIIVGVENPERREILTDENGYNYARTAVEAQEIYCLKTQRHRPWFILDLETGARGWFPGCIIKGTVEGTDIPLKSAPMEESETLELLSKARVQVLEIESIDQEPETAGWYKILYDIEGYIKIDFITDLKYESPLGA